MSSIPLTIILHGLIALVPTLDPEGTNHMTALLVDARAPHAHQCLGEHHPRLTFVVADAAQCGSAGCITKGFRCDCLEKVLANREIALSIQPVPAPAKKPLGTGNPKDPLPASSADAIDFSYVAHLSKPPFNLILDPRFLADPLPKELFPTLLARMSFDFDSVAACDLFGRDDEGQKYVHSMNFRKLQEISAPLEQHQAVAQMVIARLAIPDSADAPGQQRITLHLRRFDNAADDFAFLLAGNQGYRIELANDTGTLFPDDPCDDGVGRHFAHFYDLAVNPPDWESRLVPHVKFAHSQPIKPLIHQDCIIPDFSLADRPACPMAGFP